MLRGCLRSPTELKLTAKCEPALAVLSGVDCSIYLFIEVLELDTLWPRWVARIGVTRIGF